MRKTRRPELPSDTPRPGRPSDDSLRAVEASIDAAWDTERDAHRDETAEATALRVTADPSRHPWRLVDAAFDHLRCPECESRLGMGPAGCSACDIAHGFRFAAREPDRLGVPPGNEHAIRVSTAVLRSPHRYPAWSVEGNLVQLPIFLDGQMPTRSEQEALLTAMRRGVPVDVTGVRTFAELAARATQAVDRAWIPG